MAEYRPATSDPLRFGVFDIDPSARELHKHGVRIKLQDQPFAVLLILLEKPGQVVTKEELQQRLWPADTFVEFDKGIYNAIKRLRETLGDEAETPRYIETIPRRGYRFIAPLQRRDGIGEQLELSPAPEPIPRLTGTKRWALVASFLCVLALAVIFIRLKLWSSPPTPKVVDSVQITKDGLPKDTLLSDGSRMYFGELLPEGVALMQVSIEGGETARIPSALEEPRLYDISPTHSELLVGGGAFTSSSERPLFVMRLPAGPLHRVGDILAHDACWAPDGVHLAYLNGRDLFVAKVDGSQIHKLGTADGLADSIRFSPDGTRLRFNVFDGTNEADDVSMEIGADGGRLHRLPIHGGGGKWSADGKYYFYQTGRDIWVLPERRSILGKVELGTPAQLTAGPITFTAPTPSADGKQLFVIGGQPKGQLIQYKSKLNQFVPFLGGISAGELEVSRDGQWVAYTTYPDSNLWRSKLDGSERLQLTFAPMTAHEPRWSPDGKQILFTDELSTKIFLVPAHGGTPQQLMPGDHPNIIGAGAWLPDENSIVFVRVVGCPVDDYSCLDENSAIHLLDLKTQQVSKLPGSDRMFSTRVSPDGRYLAAFSHSQNKVMLYDFQTKRWTELGQAGGSIEWSRGSRSVYVTLLQRDQAGEAIGFSEVVRISVPDGQVERVLDLRDMSLGGLWYGWINLLPDDSLLMMVERSMHEIYRLDLHYR